MSFTHKIVIKNYLFKQAFNWTTEIYDYLATSLDAILSK